MNAQELAKTLKTKAKLKSVSVATSLLDDLVEIMTQCFINGDNVSIARLGTFKVLRPKNPPEKSTDTEAGTRSPRPIVQFLPYCAFEHTNGNVEAEDGRTRYRFIRYLPEILDCIDRYHTYKDKKRRQRDPEEDHYFEIRATDSEEHKKIKNLTRLVLFWLHNQALPDMYAEQGIEWTAELDTLCNVANELLAVKE